MLLLKNGRHRLSIDIDIICPPGTDIEQYLKSYKDFGFIDYKSVERIQRGTDIPKSHAKFFYQVAFLDDSDRQESREKSLILQAEYAERASNNVM